MANCFDVAQFFLQKCHEHSNSISNLKLLKLVYYAQGIHLAGTGDALFEEKIHAWEHGPVVAPIYHEYKSFGSGSIPPVIAFNAESIFSHDELVTLECVFEAHGDSGAWPLRQQTHKESPWLQHVLPNGAADNKEITTAEIKEFFKMKISDYSEYFAEYSKAAQEVGDKDSWVSIPKTVKNASDFITWARS